MSEDTERQARLAQIAHIAAALEKQTGCPAPLMIAQWAVESRWGAKPCGHANYFGMKKNSRDPESCTVETEEIVNGKPVEEELQFADYDSLEDSARDYAALITEGATARRAESRCRTCCSWTMCLSRSGAARGRRFPTRPTVRSSGTNRTRPTTATSRRRHGRCG
jgi:flagellum-specific peptidoglycan hydrolase FlgJ